MDRRQHLGRVERRAFRGGLSVLVGLALVAVGCSSTKHRAGSPTPTTTVSTAPQTASPDTSPTTAAASLGGSRCHSDQLHLTLDKVNQATMQQGSAFFRNTNSSATACVIDGYPGFVAYDQNLHPVPGTLRRGGSFTANDPGPRPVDLHPGASAYFAVGFATVEQPSGSNAGCFKVTSVQSIPPNETTPLKVSAEINDVCPGSLSITAVATASAFTISTP